MKIDLIAGARPNFVKIAAVIHANRETSKNKIRLIHTGQHYDKNLSGKLFRQLQIPPPDIEFRVESKTPAQQTAEIIVKYEEVIRKDKPDLCIVVGDVTSSMACAIGAKKMRIKLAHIEAGIRSGDRTMPEEINRILIDSISDIYFTTSRTASNYLLNSGIDKDQVHFVGNTMIDTLYRFQSDFRKPPIYDKYQLNQQNYFVLTLHRPENVDDEKKLHEILDAILSNTKNLPVLFPLHPRTAKTFEKYQANNLYPLPPQGYLEFNFLTKNSLAVVTDSGGITEETTVFGIPCLTLRNTTERPETVNIGTNELIGTHPNAIAAAFHKLFQGHWKKGSIPELWDGQTAKRIIAIINTLK